MDQGIGWKLSNVKIPDIENASSISNDEALVQNLHTKRCLLKDWTPSTYKLRRGIGNSYWKNLFSNFQRKQYFCNLLAKGSNCSFSYYELRSHLRYLNSVKKPTMWIGTEIIRERLSYLNLNPFGERRIHESLSVTDIYVSVIF